MKLVIFEDDTHDNFYPLSETRPLCELRCGAFTMRERIELIAGRSFGDIAVSHNVRSSHTDIAAELYGTGSVNAPLREGDTLFVNAVHIPFGGMPLKNEAFMSAGRIAAVNLDQSLTEKVSTSGVSLVKALDNVIKSGPVTVKDIPPQSFLPSYIWDLVLMNGKTITSDFSLLPAAKRSIPGIQFAHTGPAELLHIGDDVIIDPFVSIDTRKGPVIIRDGCRINSFTRIEGPSYIGENSILTGGKIREGCSFGPVCRIGGEVEDTIFQSYTNKYHDGFIGHAYAGSWVNFGALSTNSDLRNDYGTVSCVIPSGKTDTGSGKVGCFVGDYTKAGIGSLINTGSVIGIASMIVHSGRMTPPHVPSFCRFIKNELRSEKNVDRVIETNRIAASRRDMKLSAAMESLLRKKYADNAAKRDQECEEWNAALK